MGSSKIGNPRHENPLHHLQPKDTRYQNKGEVLGRLKNKHKDGQFLKNPQGKEFIVRPG